MVLSRRDLVRFALALPISTAVSAQQPDHFYVVGYVNKPGSYQHNDGLTVADAIDVAGGATRRITAMEIRRKLPNGELQKIPVGMIDHVLPNDTVSIR